MTGPVSELATIADRCADRLREADEVLVASHIDADGLTSAAVATRALERAGVAISTTFFKQLDEKAIRHIAGSSFDTILFTDFGSGQLETIVEYAAESPFTPVVVDHHRPADVEHEFHLNPMLVGIDGASELSGAGASYVLARALANGADDNRDLADLAVVGAVGDMQASGGELVGANRSIVAEGVAAGVLDEATDLAIYGTQTRPLPKLLEYATDIPIPGISNDSSGTVRFLTDLDLDLRDGDTWRRWIDLSEEEKQTLVSGLVRRAIETGVSPDKINDLIGTTYTLPAEEPGTELRDASEFSTLLNATARYERADVGLAVCLGDRHDALDAAQRLLTNHRRNLSEGLQWVRKTGVTTEDSIQWFHAEDRIPDTIVGIVAGMAYGANGVDRSRSIIAFANKSPDEVKVSARGTAGLVRRGLDLSAVMKEASRAVGGDGGGHDIAAGATVPSGRESAFIELADRLVSEQLD